MVASQSHRYHERRTGEWCNWQHSSFWYCYSGFESLFPNYEVADSLRTCYLAPSSSGLGHHPLKVAARVRIPLGVPEVSAIRWLSVRGVCAVCFTGIQAVPAAFVAGRYWYVNRRRGQSPQSADDHWVSEPPKMTAERSQSDGAQSDGVSGRGPTGGDQSVAKSTTSTH